MSEVFFLFHSFNVHRIDSESGSYSHQRGQTGGSQVSKRDYAGFQSRYLNVSRGYVTQLTLVLSGGRYTLARLKFRRPKSCLGQRADRGVDALEFEIGLH